MASCPNCAVILAAHSKRNPRAYGKIAAADPAARYKLCPRCRPSSRVHAADDFATLPQDPDSGQPEADRLRRERMWEGALFVLILVVVVLSCRD